MSRLDEPIRSRFYHKYFDGYTETSVGTEKGRKIIRVYTGDFYRQDVSSKERVTLKVVQSVLMCSMLLMFILGGCMKTLVNSARPVMLLTAVECVLLLWQVPSTVAYAAAKKNMTSWEYRSSALSVKEASCISAAVMLLIAVIAAVTAAVKGWFSVSGELRCCLLYFGAAASMAISFVVELKVPYITEPSKNVPAEGGVQIERDK